MSTTKRPRPNRVAPATSSITTYLLRTCDADLRSHGGFQWPAAGVVTCPDWDARPVCGGGLHGLLMGVGNAQLLNWHTSARWLVVAVDAALVVAIDADKVKVPRGTVVYCGERGGAIDFLLAKGANPALIPCGQASASGYQGQASASGDQGQASASGDQGQASASGDQGQAFASGYQGQASASGYQGQASASGYQGQASASGTRGQAFASGEAARAQAGTLGVIMLTWYDAAADRTRIAIGYVGENGIEAHTWYRLNEAHEFVVAHNHGYDQFAAAEFTCAADARALQEKAS